MARSPQQSPVKVRYYVWDDGNLLRMPNKLHHELLDREKSVGRFAGRKVKGIEAFVATLTSSVFKLTARGIIFNFDAEGFLDTRPSIESALEGYGTIRRFNDEDVVDLQPALRRKRHLSTYSWDIPPELRSKIKIDLMPGNRPKIRSLKADSFN